MNKIKKCSKCGQERPLTTEYWHRYKDSKDGFRGQCKDCRNKNTRQYYQENKEKIKEYQSKHYEENRDRRIAHQKQYYRNNKEERKLYYKQYYYANRKAISIKKKKYVKENRDKVNMGWQRYQARKKHLPATLTSKQWTSIKEDFNNQCAYCGMAEKEHLKELGEQLHQDHFASLNKGGGYTHNNIVPSCRSCNSSKQDKNFFEWYPKQEFYSKEREKKILEYLNYNDKGIQQLSIL